MGQGATRWLMARWRDDHVAPVEVVGVERLAEVHRHVGARSRGTAASRRPGRLLGVHDHGQRLVVDEDGFGRVLALVALLGQDHRDRLAHEADHVAARRGRAMPAGIIGMTGGTGRQVDVGGR